MHKTIINQVLFGLILDNVTIYLILQNVMKNSVVSIIIIHNFSQTSVE